MKLDKDTLAKHQFWVLLGSYLFVWFLAVLWLKVAAGGPIEEAKKNYDSTSGSLKTAQNNPINTATYLPPWEKAAAIYNGHKSVIWKDAWDFQARMFDWPSAWQSKDMTTPRTELSAEDRGNYWHRFYPDQIDNLRKNAPDWLYPVELAGGFDQVFQPLDGKVEDADWPAWVATPTREEVWLAQEDFWVKRELFLDIWRATAQLAFMGQPKEAENKPDGVEASYTYRNQTWEITLNLRKDKEGQLVIGGDSTLKNTDPNHRPQSLTSAKGEGIWFSVSQDRTRTRFEVKGEPVGWNETRAFSMDKDNERKDYNPLDGIVWENIKDHPVYLSQAFDQTNSPIRCIREIALGKDAQDCRTFYWRLQPNHTLAQLDALPGDSKGSPPGGGAPGAKGPGGGPGGPGGGPPGGKAGGPPPMPGGPAGGVPGAPAGAAGAGDIPNPTPNNEIERNRYLQPADLDKKLNPPSRHLPVALRLVVMQSHMHDVQLALANSRLRIQLTQVEFHHDKNYVPESEGDKKDNTGTGGVSRVFMGGPPDMMYGGAARMRPGAPPPMPMGGPGSMGMNGRRMPGGMMPAPPPMMAPMSGPGRGKYRPTMAPGMRMSNVPPVPGATDPKQAVQNPYDDNLVDITLYGISTLYRHPDPPKTTEQPQQPGRPGQPMPPPGQARPGQPTGQPAPPPGQPSGKQATPPPGPPQPAGQPSGKQPVPAAPPPPPPGKKG